MRSFSIQPSSLALGLALGVACLLGSALAPAAATGDTWPPAKRNIVNIFEHDLATPIAIPPGGAATLYAVPPDRWLTVTAVTASTDGGWSVRWAEDLNGVMTDKGYAVDPGTGVMEPQYGPQGCGDAIGWVFRPGSRLVLHNRQATTANVGRYVVLGYLSRD